LRQTKRPVGLVMWRGRHAWVMSGFESNGDPAPPKPDALITPATLAKQFVIRDRGRTNLGVPPAYLLVLPTRAAAGEPSV
jgi:hypothetical protein